MGPNGVPETEKNTSCCSVKSVLKKEIFKRSETDFLNKHARYFNLHIYLAKKKKKKKGLRPQT